jgi:hypothetical protein
MPVLIQVCIVLVTISLLAIALMTTRIMSQHLCKAAEEHSRLILSVQETLAKIDLFSQESRELVVSLRACVPPVLRVVERFEAVGQRTADLSSTVLEEVEGPVLTAAAVVSGLRVGANHLLHRLMHRWSQRNPSNRNGDHDHE